MNISLTKDFEVSNYGTPYIIAELGSNHNGDMDLARKLIEQAKQAGADCVKFQSWSKDTIFAKKVYKENYFLADDYRDRTDYTLEEIVDEYSISENELMQMKELCDEVQIDCTSTPFAKQEVDFLVDKLNTPFIKVASMDLNNYPFLEYLASKGKPVVLSTGLSSLAEIDKAVETIESTGNTQIVILHCVSLYPPDDSMVHLNKMLTLRQNYGYPIGFSDHTLGTSIPLASVALGACLIQKHFTLDKNMPGWDHKVSADFEEMKTICEQSKRIQKSLGSSRIQSVEDHDRKMAFRRSIVITKDLKAGHKLSRDDLDFKRPGSGISPEYLSFILGREIKQDLEADHVLDKEDLV